MHVDCFHNTSTTAMKLCKKKTIDVAFAMKVRDSSPKQNPKSAKSSKERLEGYL